MDKELRKTGEILLYNNGGEKEFVSVVFQDETFWLTQKAMAELFDVKHRQSVSICKISMKRKSLTEAQLFPKWKQFKMKAGAVSGAR